MPIRTPGSSTAAIVAVLTLTLAWRIDVQPGGPSPAWTDAIPAESLRYVTGGLIPSGFLMPARGDSFRVAWYSRELSTLGERSLLSTVRTPADEAYRFLWLRSFDHSIVVRASRRGDARFVIVEVARDARDETRGIARRDSFPVSPQQWDSLRTIIDRDRWISAAPDSLVIGIDGADWFIEGVRNGRYSAVMRWAPEDPGRAPFVRRIGLYMLHLGRVTHERIY